MRRLILEEWMSLDGFAVDREGTLDFFPASEADRFSDKDQLEFLESVDTILLGRRTYELFVDFWPTASTDEEIIADRLNEVPKLVFSNEYHFQLCPTVVGGGRPLFPALPSYANLHRVDVRTYNTGAVFLHYEPKR